MTKNTIFRVIGVCLISCIVMAVVDGIVQPGYVQKSLIKVVMFLLLPFLVSKSDPNIDLKSMFRFRKQGMGTALLVGVGIFVLILGGYLVLSGFIDFSGIVGALSENAGVERKNFIFVAVYISFVNSLLEEFFFRGFLFLNLKNQVNRHLAYLISSLSFSLYHVAMMIGWFNFWLFGLVLLGLMVGGCIFNFLDEKQGTIYTSWFTHMFANLAINAVGIILMS